MLYDYWIKKNVPYVVKAAPVTFINREFLKDELLNCLELLITGDFNKRAVIFDNHAANVSVFTKLMLQFGEDNESLFINLQSQKVYLFYDIVHLIKNVRAKSGLHFHNPAFLSLMMML